MACEFCDIIAKKGKLKVYFESPELIVVERNNNLAIGLMKEHRNDWSDSKIAGLVKITLKSVSKHNLNRQYAIRLADDCKDHLGIYATIK